MKLNAGRLLVACIAAALGCGGQPEQAATRAGSETGGLSVHVTPYGTLPDGRAVDRITLTNGSITLDAVTYGAIITALRTPDRDGAMDDVVLGFDSLAGYLGASPYFGAVVGRYANRIAGGRFTLDDTTYRLATNNGPNHLHGGVRGFDKVLWAAELVKRTDSVGVTFSYTSPDGEEGYPGTLAARVTYLLTVANEVVIAYEATTDRATPVNLSQHSYFDLSAGASGDILGHVLTIAAEGYTPVGETLIPTGEIAPVAGTPFDFREPLAIGARMADADEQLRRGGGYDHNFVLDYDGTGLVFAARVADPASGRVLEIHTTEPGLQFYSGNFLDGTITGKGGKVYGHRGGFCLETQHFPDSPNQAAFPSTVLQPGETYRSRTVWRFSVGD